MLLAFLQAIVRISRPLGLAAELVRLSPSNHNPKRKRGEDSTGVVPRLRFGLRLLVLFVLVNSIDFTARAADEPVERLIDRPAFDLVTLKSGKSIETVLLDFPNRRVPNPLPDSGTMKLSLISAPSKELSVDWKDISRIELYEQLVLKEAMRLTKAKEFVQAFAFFSFLHKNYRDLPGLERASQDYLIQDASTAFSGGNPEESLTILAALYQRNPQHRGLAKAAPIVSDQLIEKHLSDGNYAAARATLESIRKTFPQLKLTNLGDWQRKFEQEAREKLQAGERAFQAKNYDEARAGVQAAYDILPDLRAAAELLAKIQKAAPEVRVGVTAWGNLGASGRGLTFEEVRTAGLTDPQLVRMTDFGAEGGDYQCLWGTLKTNDAGIVTTLRLDEVPQASSVTADAVARALLAMTDSSSNAYSQLVSNLLKSVAISEGRTVSITWHRPHIRPEALLQTSLRGVAGEPGTQGTWFIPTVTSTDEKSLVRFQRDPTVSNGPSNIVETQYANDESAIAALVSAEVDVIDRVPVWQLERLETVRGVQVEPYRLPTVHVLRLNFENPLLATREFRRALCYAIDREDIVENILLAGAQRSGYQVLSGPFPAGSSLNDPVSYAYKRELLPRPYEPRLASVLASVARANLAKLAATQKKEDSSAKPADEKEGEKPKLPPPKPLVLAYYNSPVAQLTCQTMKLQLDGVGIPVELKELPALSGSDSSGSAAPEYDLLYTELAMNEPATEARRLLGPGGMAGHSTAYMNLALDRLDEASNWKEASSRLEEIHEIAHYDLPVIPLWQTVNHFAYRDGLTGVGKKPVTLYQNVDQWRKAVAGISP